MVEADEVLDVPVLVDARAPERYRGETEPIDPVAGRIPGAVNVPDDSSNLGAGRPVPEPPRSCARCTPRSARTRRGDGEVAVYCGSGVTAVHDLDRPGVLGVTAALYPGGWAAGSPTRTRSRQAVRETLSAESATSGRP